MFKLLALVAAIGIGYLLYQSLPDIQRYLRLRSM
jgi:hypothetical protein